MSSSILEIEIETDTGETCYNVAQFISTLKFNCKLQPFIEIKNEVIYNKCAIIFNNTKSPCEITSTLWTPLQKKYKLDNGYLYIPFVYDGYINNLDK
jgi:hypothetical protein